MRRNLIQMGYVTPDLDAALAYWTQVAGAGPFYCADYEPERQVYRGASTHITFRVAYGYLGDMQIELIQQLTGDGSAYREALDTCPQVPRGGLFHHIFLLHDGYDQSYGDFVAGGAVPCYDAYVEGVGRFCYLDARAQAGSYVELVEFTADFEKACVMMRAAHAGWDGTRPRRDFIGEIYAEL